MASNFDYKTDGYNSGNLLVPDSPSNITALDAALTAYNSTTYSTQRLTTMTKRDKIYAVRLHHLTVAGVPYSANYPVN